MTPKKDTSRKVFKLRDIEEENAGGRENRKETAFNIEKLKEAWSEMSSEFPEWTGNMKATVDAGELELNEKDYEVFLTVRNKIQKERVLKEKNRILAYLRIYLQNNYIQLNIKIKNNEENLRPYTPLDKYAAMVKKNPALKELKEKLGLDVDF